MNARTVLPVLMMLAAGPAGAGEPLSLRVSPVISVEPANLSVRATLEQDDANRAIEVIAEPRAFLPGHRSAVGVSGGGPLGRGHPRRCSVSAASRPRGANGSLDPLRESDLLEAPHDGFRFGTRVENTLGARHERRRKVVGLLHC